MRVFIVSVTWLWCIVLRSIFPGNGDVATAIAIATPDSSNGLCDAGDVITTLNGSVASSVGRDCTRVILAPKGWRIKLTIYELRLTHSTFYIHDGGTWRDTRSIDYVPGENIDGNTGQSSTSVTSFYSTSNAILLYADRISLNSDKLNASFLMFPQKPERCQCPATIAGKTICSLTDEFFRNADTIKRKCRSTCTDGYKFLAYPGNALDISCKLDETKSPSSWTSSRYLFFDPNLITCNKLTRVTQVRAVYSFVFENVSCANINLHFIEREVYGYLANHTGPYAGECFQDVISNCTVTPVATSCLAKENSSQIFLHVKDNVIADQNSTLTGQRYEILFSSVDANLTTKLQKFIEKYLIVNSTKGSQFSPINPYLKTFESCPNNELPIVNPARSCIACPQHFVKYAVAITVYSCQQCGDKERRQVNEAQCVKGKRTYPQPSFAYCLHTCPLGKFFNNASGLCEWCDYGSYQNSTSYINPVCHSCPTGNTTAFVGAKSKSDCMITCKQGQFVNYPTCVDCPIGYFMPYKGNRFYKCFQCPVDRTTLELATSSESGCVDKCTLGHYFNISLGKCLSCPNNTYQDEVKASNMRSCKRCPQSTITLSVGSTSSSSCLGPCDAGEYFDTKSHSCEKCPTDLYNDLVNHTSFKCKPCAKHKITIEKGSSNETQCIYACGKGEFFNLTSKTCEQCANGTYQDKVGQRFCLPCPGSTFTVKTGSVNCIQPCQFGQFLNISAEVCLNCPPGYFQNSSNHKSSVCFPCPVDFYSEKDGQRNCSACPAGRVTLVTAATSMSLCVDTCSPGFLLNKTTERCERCHQGFYQDQPQFRHAYCTKCPGANLTTLGLGSTSVKQCVGYCASSPCLNGAKCVNIANGFNCSCSKFLTGKQCEMVVDRSNADRMEVSVRFTGIAWNSNLSDPDSADFVKLAREVETAMREEFKNYSTIRTVNVNEFRQGSVVGIIEFIYVAGTAFENPLDLLKSVSADGKVGDLIVDTTSFQIYNYTCSQPLGMENGRIPDEALTSANENNHHPFGNARLNTDGPGWTPDILYLVDAYLQVDFQEVVLLTGIATQGSSYRGGSWLQGYHFNYSLDGRQWKQYLRRDGRFKVFGANRDINSIVRNRIENPVRARYVRIIEYYFHNRLSFRIEFYGCPIPKTDPLPTLAPAFTFAPTGSRPTGSSFSSGPTGSPFSSGPTGSSSTPSDTTSTSIHGDDDDDSNVGLIVGLVVGILALFLIVTIFVWYFRRKKSLHSFGTSSTNLPMKQTR